MKTTKGYEKHENFLKYRDKLIEEKGCEISDCEAYALYMNSNPIEKGELLND